jgi:hypothetical protein
MKNIKERGSNRLKCLEPPIGYSSVGAIIQQKRQQRELMKTMKLNEYLSDTQSDFDEHKSVASENVKKYENMWKANMRKYNKLHINSKDETNKVNTSKSRYLDNNTTQSKVTF